MQSNRATLGSSVSCLVSKAEGSSSWYTKRLVYDRLRANVTVSTTRTMRATIVHRSDALAFVIGKRTNGIASSVAYARANRIYCCTDAPTNASY